MTRVATPGEVREMPASVQPPAPLGATKQTNLLTADELAARWQVQTSQVYRLTREGALPTVRLGRYYRYRLAAVEEFEVGGGATNE